MARFKVRDGRVDEIFALTLPNFNRLERALPLFMVVLTPEWCFHSQSWITGLKVRADSIGKLAYPIPTASGSVITQEDRLVFSFRGSILSALHCQSAPHLHQKSILKDGAGASHYCSCNHPTTIQLEWRVEHARQLPSRHCPRGRGSGTGVLGGPGVEAVSAHSLPPKGCTGQSICIYKDCNKKYSI